MAEPQWRCPTCGRYLEDDPDGFYDVEPGGHRGHDPVVPYCNEACCDRKEPPAIPEYPEVCDECAQQPAVEGSALCLKCRRLPQTAAQKLSGVG